MRCNASLSVGSRNAAILAAGGSAAILAAPRQLFAGETDGRAGRPRSWPAGGTPALRVLALALLTLLTFLPACGDDESALADEFERPPAADASQGVPDAGAADVSPGPQQDASVDEEPFIPEQPEEDFRFQPPAASRSFVYVANTDLNAVARIDSLTLEVRTIEVGLEPTLVRTSPAGDQALVLNEGSSDVSIISGGAEDPVLTIDVTIGANSLVLDPDGDYAVAWYNDRRAEAADVAGSLNDATLIRLGPEGAEAFNLVVGLHIREVEFDDAGTTAFFVTDDGVSVVALDEIDRDRFVPPVRVSADPLEDAQAVDREVEVTPDGRYALVRTSTSSALRLVTLADGTLRELDLGAIPTDVDLLPSGDRAVAVLRELGEVAVAAIPGSFDGTELVETYDLGDEVVGLALPVPGRDLLALYSTLDENDHLSLLDLSEGSVETWALRKGIESIFASPDGTRLLVLHTKLSGEPVPGSEDFVARSYGYSIFSLGTQTTRLILTDARPGDFTFSTDGTMAFLILSDPARDVRAIEWVNLVTGRDQTISLRRTPEAIGLIPATDRVFVSQEHEVGRMAFIDPDTGEVREVTGYHLNSRTE